MISTQCSVLAAIRSPSSRSAQSHGRDYCQLQSGYSPSAGAGQRCSPTTTYPLNRWITLCASPVKRTKALDCRSILIDCRRNRRCRAISPAVQFAYAYRTRTQRHAEQTMRRLTVVVAIAFSAVTGCAKSPVQATVDTANKVSMKLMSGIAQKDASTQVEGLIRNLETRPECDVYKKRLREVEPQSPAAGATQSVIVRTYDAAGKAGCVKPN
jgi:hypothetical protein